MLIQIKEKGRDRSIMLGRGAADALCEIAHLKGFVVFRNSSLGHAAFMTEMLSEFQNLAPAEFLADYVGNSGDSLRSRADLSLSSEPPNTLGNR